jgi:hypothetical protein
MSDPTKQDSSGRAMLVPAQFVLAGLLIAASSAMVLLWFASLSLSYGGHSGLMPWTAAAVILYGLFFVGLAAIPGVPGILWANHLAACAPLKWQKIAKIPGWIGTLILTLGLASSAAVLVREQFRPRNPYDGCVSYRDAAASAALASAGPGQNIDCPSQR